MSRENTSQLGQQLILDRPTGPHSSDTQRGDGGAVHGVRVLLARGYDPATPYSAALGVVDAATGTRFRKFVPSGDADERIGQAAE